MRVELVLRGRQVREVRSIRIWVLDDVYFSMKRLQIYIDEGMDEALAVRAVKERTSKAALIRQFVGERLGPSAPADPLDDLVGRYDEAPGSIDQLVYER